MPHSDCVCVCGRSAGGSERHWLRRSVESVLEVRRALGRGGGRSAGGSERPWLRRSVESIRADCILESRPSLRLVPHAIRRACMEQA